MKDLLLENAFEKLSSEGFLVLKIPANVEETVRTTLEAAYPFFRSTVDEKMASRLPADTGYRQFAGEYSQSPDRPDQVESFTASVRMNTSAANLNSKNAQALYQQMLRVIDEFEPIAELVTGILATRINHLKTESEFCGAFRLWSFLQLNYSRPREVSEEFINDLHEDGCLLTITCTTAPGLELRTPAGEFVRVTTNPDEVLILPGEILWLMSGGLIQPLYHRVRPETRYQERMSLLFFGDIDPALCKPWLVNNVNESINIPERVFKNPTRFGLTEWNWK